MTFYETPLFANIIYLVLVAGIWLAVLAVLQPGTGALEVLVVIAFSIVGLSTLVLQFNSWALLIILGGAVLFVIALRNEKPGLWVALSALAFSAGSSLLFGIDDEGTAVHPFLAITVTILTVGYFWLAIRGIMISQRAAPAIDPSRVLGQIAEVRSPLDPVGAVYVGEELWTARADTLVDVGEHVTVVSADGLILKVEPVEDE
jgi:membrane-bound serine protease (ClpP class)